MATLREYFEKDQNDSFGLSKPFILSDSSSNQTIEVSSRLNLNFETNSLHISFYIPATNSIASPVRVVLNAVEEVLKLRNDIYMETHLAGEDTSCSDEAIFTGRIYVYSENDISEEDRSYVISRAKELGQSVKFRGQLYAKERSALEKPLAFISHDSRDKESIAKPLALALQRLGCPVWYDEFSLKVGHSLRESIESGLKECKKCIFIISPNFLENGGWTKKEYDSVFTRELVERDKVILPIWHDVTAANVFEYSPSLADRFAIKWNEDIENIARQLSTAIRD